MRFAYPEVRWLLLAVPLLVAVFLWARARRRTLLAELGDAGVLGRLGPRSTGAWPALRRTALLGAVALLTLAAARPQSALDWVNVSQKGVDIVVALDVSLSMTAEDIKPSRLARARQDVKDLLQRLEGDRVGLVVFAGEAVVQSPLTVDYSAIRLMLDVVEPGMLARPGTALADALTRARECFDDDDRSDARAILLITDGESHEGDVDAAIEETSRAGVRVYALGMGRVEGEPIPIVDERGGRSYKSDREGRVVMSRLDEALLERIAVETGGAYIPVGRGAEGVDYVADLLADLEEKAFEAGMFKLYDDRYVVFLAPAVLLLALELLIGDAARRRRSAGSRATRGGPAPPRGSGPDGRAVATTAVGLLVLCTTVLGTGAAAAERWSREAIEAARAYEAGDYAAAASGYREAIVSGDARPELSYNLANARFRAGAPDSAALAEAIGDWQRAARAGDAALTSSALYNAGNAQAELDNLAEAERIFKDVLRGDPGNAEARYNLELVQRMLESQEPDSSSSPEQQPQDQQQDQDQDRGQEGQQPPDEGPSPDQPPPDSDDPDDSQDSGQEPPDDGSTPPDASPDEQQTPQGGDASQGEEPQPEEARISPEEARRELDKLEEAEREHLRQLLEARRSRVPVEKDW